MSSLSWVFGFDEFKIAEEQMMQCIVQSLDMYLSVC